MGRKKCVFCGETRKLNGISYHRFPPELESKDLWLKSLKMDEKTSATVGIHSVLCSQHFHSRDIIAAGSRQFLSANAVPILTLGSTSRCRTTNQAKRSRSSTIQVKEHTENTANTEEGMIDVKLEPEENKEQFENLIQDIPTFPEVTKNEPMKYVGSLNPNADTKNVDQEYDKIEEQFVDQNGVLYRKIFFVKRENAAGNNDIEKQRHEINRSNFNTVNTDEGFKHIKLEPGDIEEEGIHAKRKLLDLRNNIEMNYIPMKKGKKSQPEINNINLNTLSQDSLEVKSEPIDITEQFDQKKH